MEILRGIGDRANAVRAGARRAAELKRVESRLEAGGRAFERLTGEIGRACVDARAGDAEARVKIEEMCASARGIKSELCALEARVEGLTGAQRCSACGARRRRSDRFCPECGREYAAEGEASAREAEVELEEFARGDEYDDGRRGRGRWPEQPSEPVEAPRAEAEQSARPVYINWPGSGEGATKEE